MKVERQNELVTNGRRAGRFILKTLKQLSVLMLRAILTSFVFYVAGAVALHSMGLPVPRLSDLNRYLHSLSELTKILS